MALLRAGKLDEAEVSFLEILKAAPSAGCASGGLVLVRAARCEKARRLLEEHRRGDARAIVEELQKAHPGSRCASDVLDELEDSQPLRDLTGEVRSDVAFWVPIGLLLFAGLVLAIALLLNVRRIRRRVARTWLLRRLFPVRLAIGTFDGAQSGVGEGFASLVRAALYRLRRNGRRSYDVDGVSGYEGFGKTLARFGDVSSQFKVAGELVAAAAAAMTSRFTLSGTRIDAQDDRGRGASVALEERGSMLRSSDLWAGKEPPVEPGPEQLALAVAAWTDQQVVSLHRADRRLISGTPESRALASAGSELMVEDPRVAELFLRRALAHDPRDAGAALNLAVHLMRTSREGEGWLVLYQYKQAVEMLA